MLALRLLIRSGIVADATNAAAAVQSCSSLRLLPQLVAQFSTAAEQQEPGTSL
jgi:hypothetical protein